MISVSFLLFLFHSSAFSPMIAKGMKARLIIVWNQGLKKNSGFNRIRTHDLCDTGAGLYQLSYQANSKLVTLWVRNIPVDDKGCIHEKLYIWTVEKDMKAWLIIVARHTTLVVVKLMPEKKSGVNSSLIFSGFNFTTTKIVCLTAMINHAFIWPVRYRCSTLST